VVGEAGLELGGRVALVGDEGLAGPAGQQRRVGVEQVDRDLALVDLGVRQREGDRQPGGGGDQVQPQAPQVQTAAVGQVAEALISAVAGLVGVLEVGRERLAMHIPSVLRQLEAGRPCSLPERVGATCALLGDGSAA
jgi:hypothetical protein